MINGVRLLDHTADFGMEITAADPARLFVRAAEALFFVIAGIRFGGAGDSRTMVIQGADWPDLLVNWLRELLYLWAGEQRIACNATMASITEYELRADVTTVDHDARIHDIQTEIKAVTYHQVDVAQTENGWRATVYLDV